MEGAESPKNLDAVMRALFADDVVFHRNEEGGLEMLQAAASAKRTLVLDPASLKRFEAALSGQGGEASHAVLRQMREWGAFSPRKPIHSPRRVARIEALDPDTGVLAQLISRVKPSFDRLECWLLGRELVSSPLDELEHTRSVVASLVEANSEEAPIAIQLVFRGVVPGPDAVCRLLDSFGLVSAVVEVSVLEDEGRHFEGQVELLKALASSGFLACPVLRSVFDAATVQTVEVLHEASEGNGVLLEPQFFERFRGKRVACIQTRSEYARATEVLGQCAEVLGGTTGASLPWAETMAVAMQPTGLASSCAARTRGLFLQGSTGKVFEGESFAEYEQPALLPTALDCSSSAPLEAKEGGQAPECLMCGYRPLCSGAWDSTTELLWRLGRFGQLQEHRMFLCGLAEEVLSVMVEAQVGNQRQVVERTDGRLIASFTDGKLSLNEQKRQ